MENQFLDINRILLIKKVYAKYINDQCKEYPASFAIFACILNGGEVETQQQLSDMVCCNKSHTSRTLFKMQLKGLVKLGKTIELTNKGKLFAKKILKTNDKIIADLFENVSTEEKETFKKVLGQIIENAKVM